MSDFSLADLAGLDVSDVQEIRFSSLPAMVADFKVVSVSLEEGKNRDDEQRFYAEFKFEVVDCLAVVDKNEKKEDLVGRNHTEKLYIVPTKAEEGIGLIRAFVADMGCPNAGALQAILDGTVGHIFRAKIKKRKDRNDPSIEYSRLELEAAKK